MQKTNLIQALIIIFVAAIFSVVLLLGWKTGKSVAAASAVFQNANQLSQGFQYFKQDQDRYPTEFEYSNHDLMSVYFSVFPPANIKSSNCPSTNFLYQTSDPKTYILNFCLAHSYDKYISGWNKVSPAPIIQ